MTAEQPWPTAVEIAWEQARDANRANWDDRAVLHESSYGLEEFDDPTHLSQVVADDLPVLVRHLPGSSVAGLSLVHLQCHIGTDTVSLARAGAHVTGVDFSPAALEVARSLATRTGAEIRLVESDVLEAADAVGQHADVVYTSIGAICWLQELDRWAEQIASLLRPGGVFFIRDGHPVLYAVDESASELVLRHPYFASGRAQRWEDDSTYSGDGRTCHPVTYEWPHPLSEIVGVLIEAGLVIERLDEGRDLPWRFSPRMVEVEPGRYAWPEGERDLVPCTFTIVARRPG